MKRLVMIVMMTVGLAAFAQQEIQPGGQWQLAQYMFGETSTVVVPCPDLEGTAERFNELWDTKDPGSIEVMCGQLFRTARSFRSVWDSAITFQDVFLDMRPNTAWALVDEGVYYRRYLTNDVGELGALGVVHILIDDEADVVEMGWYLSNLF